MKLNNKDDKNAKENMKNLVREKLQLRSPDKTKYLLDFFNNKLNGNKITHQNNNSTITNTSNSTYLDNRSNNDYIVKKVRNKICII